MIMGEENLTSSEVADLLHVADAAWRTTIDHLARANAATPLNVNPVGSPLLETKTLHLIYLHQQLLDRRGDTTYYNPKPKEAIRR